MSELLRTLTTKLLQQPEFIQIAGKLLPCFGKVLYYDFDKKLSTIQFVNPVDGRSTIQEKVPVKTQRGISGDALKVGDTVMIFFPGGGTDSPLVVAVYEPMDYGDLGGSYQTGLIF